MSLSTKLIPESITHYQPSEVYDGEINTDSSTNVHSYFAKFRDNSSCVVNRLYAVLIREGTHVLFQSYTNETATVVEIQGMAWGHLSQIERKLLCHFKPTGGLIQGTLAPQLPKVLLDVILGYHYGVEHAHALMRRELEGYGNNIRKEIATANTLTDDQFLKSFAAHQKQLIPVGKSTGIESSNGIASEDELPLIKA